MTWTYIYMPYNQWCEHPRSVTWTDIHNQWLEQTYIYSITWTKAYMVDEVSKYTWTVTWTYIFSEVNMYTWSVLWKSICEQCECTFKVREVESTLVQWCEQAYMFSDVSKQSDVNRHNWLLMWTNTFSGVNVYVWSAMCEHQLLTCSFGLTRNREQII